MKGKKHKKNFALKGAVLLRYKININKRLIYFTKKLVYMISVILYLHCWKGNRPRKQRPFYWTL